MGADETGGKVMKIEVYERKVKANEWIGPLSLLCFKIEIEGSLRGMVPPKYAEIVFSSIEDAPPRNLRGFCETGYHLVEYPEENVTRYCFSLPKFNRNYVEIHSEQLRSEMAKKYIGEMVYEILEEFPAAKVEGKELLN